MLEGSVLHRQCGAEKYMKDRFKRLLLLFALLALVMTASIMIVSITSFSNAIKADRADVVAATAKLAAHVIDGDKINQWLENGGDDEAYTATSRQLYDLLSFTPNIEYLYVYKIEPDGCHVVFDFDNPDGASEDLPVISASAIGEVVEFDESFEPYLPALFAGERIEMIESKDTYGWLLTQYEPIYDSNGNCVAYVGADISVHGIQKSINSITSKVVLICILFLAACIFIGMRMSIHFHRAEEVDALLEKQQNDKRLLKEFIEAFATVIDLKDSYTQGHSFRVANYTQMLAQELGYDEETVEKYYNIALLHDIGKIGIPDAVLNKPGKLTDDEFALIKSHTERGEEVLKNISLMPEILIGALSHHERPDGHGYPQGLSGEEIPRVAQIIAVADCFDAMYSNRPYRNRMNFDKVVSIIRESSGTQLTPDVVDAFLRLVEKGKFRAPDDHGGGSMETIENIHEKENAESQSEHEPKA